MPSVRLRMFLVLSLILHTALFAVVAFYRTEAIVTKPQVVKVGVMNDYKDPGIGGGNSSDPPQKEAPKLRSNQVARQQNLEKKVVKTVAKKEKAKEARKINKSVNKSVIEQPELKVSQIMEGEETSVHTGNATLGLASSKAGKGIGTDGLGLGTEGSGKGVEIGYPDYKINPKPNYPMIARRKGYEGVVLLKVWVLEDGSVGKLELQKSSNYEMLDKSAMEAVENWIFIPGKKGGEPIPSWVTVPIKFQLSSNG